METKEVTSYIQRVDIPNSLLNASPFWSCLNRGLIQSMCLLLYNSFSDVLGFRLNY